ncbi:MAG: uroporphyrinogen-III C-methyltransferase [Candidatus Omnitrophica bacterium]|nr:uroporphyrinogen-III C-methyltransferase [Candidatus Omnitrophota bacterium]
MKRGKVYLVGAGPGEPDLITVKGLKVLQQADVVIYDYLVAKSILKYTKPETEKICVDELDKEIYKNGFTKNQDKINQLMVEKAKKGKNVVRLKNGDPSIFGRMNEELEFLRKNNIAFRIVPGVTAATACACYTGIPLTARDISSTICITTGHEANLKHRSFVDFSKVAKIDTIILFMSVETLNSVVEKIISNGKDKTTPVCVVSNISRINQKTVVGNLDNIVEKVKKEKISAPAIVIIGDVVKKEKDFNWFKKTKKVLFTGLSSERFFEDGLIFHIPMIEIKPLKDYTELDNWIKSLNVQFSTHNEKIDWIFFTSRFGVYYFFERLFKLGFDTRILNGIKIAAIGYSTANKLKEYGIIADLVPKNECSEGLLEEFKDVICSMFNAQCSMKILLPRSDIADKGLTEALKKLGCKVFSCVAYRNVMPENLPEIDFSFFDKIIFSSPSTVRNFIKRYGKSPLEEIEIKAIGPVTKKELKKWVQKKISLI